jgi:hypothetical protein
MVYVKRVSYKFADKKCKRIFFDEFFALLGWFEGVFGGGLVFIGENPLCCL